MHSDWLGCLVGQRLRLHIISTTLWGPSTMATMKQSSM